jgi:hypothetical protein
MTEIVNFFISADIKNCDGTYNSIAAIIFKILKDKYIYTNSNGKIWYKFDGSNWIKDDGIITLRHELSTTIKDKYIYTYNIINRNEIKSYEKLLKTAMKLQNYNHKTNIIKEMQEYFINNTEIIKK